jgi:hypothetical protein
MSGGGGVREGSVRLRFGIFGERVYLVVCISGLAEEMQGLRLV